MIISARAEISALLRGGWGRGLGFFEEFEKNAFETVDDYMENISIWAEILAGQMDLKLHVREKLGMCGVLFCSFFFRLTNQLVS